MTLSRGNQTAITTLTRDSTVEDVMMWLAQFPQKAKVSAIFTSGDRPWESGSTSVQVDWDAQQVSDELDETYTNLDSAESIISRIDVLKKIQNALKAAFAHRDLDGGPKAALEHDLYIRAQAEIDSLEEELTQLI